MNGAHVLECWHGKELLELELQPMCRLAISMWCHFAVFAEGLPPFGGAPSGGHHLLVRSDGRHNHALVVDEHIHPLEATERLCWTQSQKSQNRMLAVQCLS